jgi:DNA-binding MarR family transcriptional regulator
MGEAGDALDLAPSAMSGLVDRMCKADLIERRQNEQDGRKWHLWLRPEGGEALSQGKEGLAELNAILTDGFTEEEIEIVGRWLESLQTKFP